MNKEQLEALQKTLKEEVGADLQAEFKKQLEAVKNEADAKFAEMEANQKSPYAKMKDSEKEEMAVTFIKALGQNDKKTLKDLAELEISTFTKAASAEFVEGTDANGGYLVPKPVREGIIASAKKYGIARKYATMIPMTRKELSMPRLKTDASFAKITEGSSYGDLAYELDNVNLVAEKWGGKLKLTEELLADANVDMLSFLYSRFGIAQARAEDALMFTNIFADAGVNVQTLGAGQDTYVELTFNDLLDSQDLLDEGLDDNAIYAFHRTIISALRKLKDSQGRYIMNDPGVMTSKTIWDVPFVKSPVLPSKSATPQLSTKFGVYGDLSNVFFGDRKIMTIKVLRELYAAEGKVGVLVDSRFDIKVGNAANLVALRTAAS